MIDVVDLGPHLPPQLLGVPRTGPLEVGDRGVGALELEALTSLAGLGEQVAGHLYAMTHHVRENAPSLPLAEPEPGGVGPAVLLGGAGEVRSAGSGNAAAPDNLLPPLHGRREDLV